MAVSACFEQDSITVSKRKLRAFEFDATNAPDLFPALAALAAAAEGESVIIGTERLRHKESDRAETIQREYEKLGIEVDISQKNIMRIRGGEIQPATTFSHPSGSSQCTSPKHPVSCIKPGLAILACCDSWGRKE